MVSLRIVLAVVAVVAGQTITAPKPSVPSLAETLVAAPFAVTSDRPAGWPGFAPGPGCPPSPIRVSSSGGYAPIVWSLVSGGNRFALVDPNATTSTPTAAPATATNPLLKKPASPTTRVLRLTANWPAPTDSLVTPVTVQAVDGANQQKSVSLTVRPTRACGRPSVMSISSPATNSTDASAEFAVQVSDFDTLDNLHRTEPTESRVECAYPDGLRLVCLEELQSATGIKGTVSLRDFQGRCSPAAPCSLRVPNLKGSGPIAVRLVNPYGSSPPATVNVTFGSSLQTENRTFQLPSTIAQQPAVVEAGPTIAGGFGDSITPCTGRYWVWRNVTYSDPSGRAKLTRPVKPGVALSESTFPQWTIAPGSGTLTMQITYEIERRQTLCSALVVR